MSGCRSQPQLHRNPTLSLLQVILQIIGQAKSNHVSSKKKTALGIDGDVAVPSAAQKDTVRYQLRFWAQHNQTHNHMFYYKVVCDLLEQINISGKLRSHGFCLIDVSLSQKFNLNILLFGTWRTLLSRQLIMFTTFFLSAKSLIFLIPRLLPDYNMELRWNRRNWFLKVFEWVLSSW